MAKNQRKQGRRAPKIAVGVIVGVFVLFGVFFAVDYVLNKGHVPRGSTVAGVDISTLSSNQAEAKLEQSLGDIATRKIDLRAGQRLAVVDPASAGLSINWEETVAQAGKQTANPITWVRSFFSKHELDIVSDVDQGKFNAEVDRLAGELSVAPVDGAVSLKDGRVEESRPVIGQSVDKQELGEELSSEWLKPGGIDITPSVAAPAIGEEQVRQIADGEAKTAVSSPITAKGRDGINGIIPVERMGEVVTFVRDGEKLRADVNTDRAREILSEGLSASEVEVRNAQVSFAGGDKAVTPSVDGVEINWEDTLKDFAPRVTGEEGREFDAVYKDVPATFTTQQAEAARFDDVVGEFTTGGFTAESGTNIALTAQMVNGAFVAPGETFSLNGYTGPRGTAQGFVESGIILNGHADKAVGGGISQFATTLYNAAYFAGMEDVAHTAHSYYISRYPAGREATVFEGAIDLQFKNTSANPVIIESFVDGGQVTVRLKGVKTVDVESVNGGRWNYTSPQPMNLSGPTCSPSSGAQGFTTSDTRIIRDLAGNEISRQTQTTVYDPQPIVRCS